MEIQVQTLNKKFHWITGCFVFFISFIAYFKTVAPTTSFWDCGEFIACSYILGVMHPPGAPLYMLIGKIMTMLPLAKDIGLRVNLFSVFATAVTVLLTYLIIVQLIRRWRGDAKTWLDFLILYGSGLFGSLAFAFTDSLWFNGIEAEVYAFSILLTAMVVWLALYWGERSEKAGSTLLILLIFYLFALATGVHLLNILAFPFVLLIAFFHENQTIRRLLLVVSIQAAVPIFLYMLFYQFNPESMQYNEILKHQANAQSFLKICGLICVGVGLIYLYTKDRKAFALWWIIPVLWIVAYSTYILIYIRAGMNPPINENDPSTFQAMMDYLTRKQYGTEDMLLTFLYRKADFWQYQVGMLYTRYFGWQFIGKGATLDQLDRINEIISFRGIYGIPFFIGLWGAIHHFFKDWKRALAVLVLFFLTGYAIIVYLNQPDPQPRERDYVYVGSFFAFALWVGIGFASTLEVISDALREKEVLKKIVCSMMTLLLFIGGPISLFAFNYTSHDRTGNYVAYDYSYNILDTCEPNAIIFTNGDNDTFPLWFLQEVYQVRKDVRVVNLSLLNTHWYIRQLRDMEPKIPIKLNDQAIDKLMPTQFEKQKVEIPIPENLYRQLNEELGDQSEFTISREMVFELEPTWKAGNIGALRVQDMMILRILQTCAWKRPIYFAVTVSHDNMIGLDQYLRMDGLAFKVMPYPVNHKIDADIIRKNLFSKYQYRGLNNPDVYFNVNILKLLQNYRSAFTQLAIEYLQQGQKDEARYIVTQMEEHLPEEIIPYSEHSAALYFAKLYEDVGLPAELERREKLIIPGQVLTRKDRTQIARQYAQFFGDWDRAEDTYQKLIYEDPTDIHAISELFGIYEMSHQYDKAIPLLEDWLMRNPADKNAQKELERLQKLISEEATQ